MTPEKNKGSVLSSKHLLGLEGMAAEEIVYILDTADTLKEILDRHNVGPMLG